MDNIICTHCKVAKFPPEFADDRRKSNGKCSWCRQCMRDRQKKRFEENPGLSKEYYQRYKKRMKLKRTLLKERVFAAYGHECNCCEENKIEFLCIDLTLQLSSEQG